MPTALLWLRHDLRLHDHGPLADALDAAGEDGRLLAVACFDPRHHEPTALGFPKTDAYRAQFVLESLADLRRSMRARGGDLVVRHGRPEDVLPALAAEAGATSVHLTGEPMQEEAEVEAAVRDALPGLDWGPRWGHTLVDVDALPFAVSDAPDTFSPFRKAVEKRRADDRYPAPRPAPDRLPPPPDIDPGEIPSSVEALGLDPRQPDERRGFRIRGGETEGLARLGDYVWDKDRLRTYKETRNGMLDPDDSSKLSPWLAHGCLSPRRVQAEVARYEAERERNKSTYWLTFELLWRDFFRVYGAKHGDRLFWPSGPKGERGVSTRLDEAHFLAWREGRTGLPLVDASMRELNATGFMSNRGRQNAASFLVKHLDLDWRAGAAYFESLLVDYDVTSNWGNWAYVAGVGSDPRDRYFDVELQLKKYDPEAAFVKHWLPALEPLPPPLAREPYRMTGAEQERYGVRLGEDYPRPILDYGRVTGRLRAASRPGRDARGSTGGRGRRQRSRR
jgi:deoxyribodipyrimidine photo-lyase